MPIIHARKIKASWTFLLSGRCCGPHLYCLCDKTVLGETSQRYIGDGINDRCFYIGIQIPVVALSAIFSYVYLFYISPVLGCIAIIHLLIDQHIKRFSKTYLGFQRGWRVSELTKKN